MMKMLGSLIASAALILSAYGCGQSYAASDAPENIIPVTQVSVAAKGSEYQYTKQDVFMLRDYLLNVPRTLTSEASPMI